MKALVVFFTLAGSSIGFCLPQSAPKPSTKITCEEFLQLDEVSRPKIVYWFDGFNRKGTVDETIDFDQSDRLVPVLVEECTKTPKHLLVKKMKLAQKKTASN